MRPGKTSITGHTFCPSGKVDSDDFSHKKWALACANAQNQTHYLSYKPCSFGCGWNASLPRCCRPGSGICRSPLLSCLMLRVLRATLRGPAGPLPQVHPGKWYPSVGTWTSREGCLGKLGWMSGGVLNAIIRAKGPCTLFCKTRGCNKLDDPPEPFLNESALRRYDATRIGSARTGLVIEWV